MHVNFRLKLVFIATACLLASLAATWLRPEQESINQLLALAGALVVAAPIVYSTITAIRETGFAATEFYMDQFVTLAIATCLATGRYTTGAIVAIILVLGQMLEERTVIGVEGALARLKTLSKVKARKIAADNSEEEVDSETLQAGDRVRIRPGDYIPADARILSGSSLINQANITGESLPEEAMPGQEIFAGTVNLTGSLEAEVRESGQRTVVARILQIIEDAKSTEAPLIRLAEDCARYYTPLIILVALSVFFFTQDTARAIAVLIVSIPCAFVLASPSAMVSAIASASRMGLLIKSVRDLETSHQIDVVVFDKTGTLTEGNLQLESAWSHNGHDHQHALALAASLENHSNHPVAKALTTSFQGELLASSEVSESSGRGISGIVDGHEVKVGRRSWLEEQGVTVDETMEDAERLSLLHVAIGGIHAATFGLADRMRSNAPEAIARLRQAGVQRVIMLTGDRPSVAATIAARCGIDDFQAQCLPEDKQKHILALKEQGLRVLVVGDGLNDGPMLASGDLSIAMGALGNDVAIHAADVALMNNDLLRVADLIELSRRTVQIVNQNLLWGFGLILIAIVLSSAGFINPILAAFFHEFSAFFVIFNSARLLRFDGREEDESEPPFLYNETELQQPAPIHA